MSATYIPRSGAELAVWLGNFTTVLPIQAKGLGMPPAEQKEALDGAKALVESLQKDEQKRAEWLAATAHTAELKQQALPVIQRTIERLRTTPGFTEEVNKALMAVPPRAQALALDEHKPVIRGTVTGGKVQIGWTRGSLDGINVYSRKQGDSAWVLLGHDSRPPYDDPRPINSVEVREYRAIGVSHDQEVGQPSDTIAVAVSV